MISTSSVCQYCLSVFYLQHSLFFLWHYYLLLHIDVCVYLYKVTWYDGVQFFIWVHLSSGLLLHVVRICRVESATARRYINLSFLLFNSLFANCHDNSCICVCFLWTRTCFISIIDLGLQKIQVFWVLCCTFCLLK